MDVFLSFTIYHTGCSTFAFSKLFRKLWRVKLFAEISRRTTTIDRHLVDATAVLQELEQSERASQEDPIRQERYRRMLDHVQEMDGARKQMSRLIFSLYYRRKCTTTDFVKTFEEKRQELEVKLTAAQERVAEASGLLEKV